MFAQIKKDIDSIMLRDPAAKTRLEAALCYPGLHAIWLHRIAHHFYLKGWVVFPRLINTFSRFLTGIDIHPGASVGEAFFIDHGTGVVIGETCVIGRGCRLYQGVTLGALSFPKGADGVLIKGIPRHPKLEDDVTVYAGATILGNITIGAGSVIGANTWVTRDVPRNSKVVSGD